MNKHLLKGSASASARPIERKNDNGGGNRATGSESKNAIENFMHAFEEFKQANDDRLSQIEKIGTADILSEEKTERINAVLDKFEDVNQKATMAEKNAKALKELQENFDALETAIKRSPTGNTETKQDRVNDWARAVVAHHIIGAANLSENQRKAIEDVEQEWKALNVGTSSAGGHLAPAEFVREIIKAETLLSPVRSLARVRQTANRSVEIPKRTGQFAAQWVAEHGSKSETTGLTYGLEEVPTHEFYALIDISNQMLEDSAFNMQAEISEESSEQFSVAEGTAFVTGDGIGKPEGFMTNSNVGETNQGEAADLTDGDGLLELKHAIKTAYARNASWVMNRTTIGKVRRLKDGSGNYLWIPGVAQGAPNTIDGDPYVEMPDMPDVGAGLYPIAYGDFRRAYTWVDRVTMEMLRDPYTQATSGNVRFIMRKRVGGQVVLPEAIQKLKISA
ncbi:hypothetical protein MXMO3_01808 [Maritalea myrionectae]|uniref:Phage capsid-like C-terminal domain-containing protein n=1 Tax=Maritalea myrionectae TaxID=454601 RepID=A0A2R4MEC9_9HYPH|nr:phage major capsid protein [Maritalea myrionectae]AVX04333.1 hypothetical protein MXMO3_01808 [Maritalea myrionectae]